MNYLNLDGYLEMTRALSCLGCGGRRPVDVDLCDACRSAEVEPTEDEAAAMYESAMRRHERVTARASEDVF